MTCAELPKIEIVTRDTGKASGDQDRECRPLHISQPMPQLASDVDGGKSGQNHPTSHQNPIHISRMACNAYLRVGWYGEGVYLLQLPLKDSCIAHVRLPIGRRHRAILNMFIIGRRPPDYWSPDEAPTADARSGTHSHWPNRQHRGTIGASNRLM